MFKKSICKLPLPHINFSELLNQDFVIFGGTSLIGSSVGVVFNHCFASVGMWRACKIKGKRHVGKPRASEVEEGDKDISEWEFFTTFCPGRLIRTSSTTGLPPPSPSSDSLPDAFRPRFGPYLVSTLFLGQWHPSLLWRFKTSGPSRAYLLIPPTFPSDLGRTPMQGESQHKSWLRTRNH